MSALESDTSTAGGETVLVVETEVLVRMALADYLRECGFRVLEAAGVVEAMMIFEQTENRIDVVLSAVELSGETSGGFTLARWIRRVRPHVEVILAGAIAKAADAAGELCERRPHSARPHEPQVLVDKIRRLLARRGRP